MAHLSKSIEKGHLFFVSAENSSTSMGSFLKKYKIKLSPNQIITQTAQMSRIYEKMYDDLERNVEDVKTAIDTPSPYSKRHAIRRKLTCIEKKLKERRSPNVSQKTVEGN